MSKFFGFLRKKSNKENEQPASQEVLYRNHSVRGSRRGGERSFRYEEDHLSPSSINPYHSVGKPRAKGPRSCPGGYREEQIHYDDYEREAVKSRTKADRFRRSVRDTSEYGSGDPSPIGHNGRHSHHYNASVMYDTDEDEEEDFQRETERKLQEKLKYSEAKRYQYKEKILRIKQEKEQCEGAFHERLNRLDKENRALKNENEHLKNKLMRLEAQLQQVTRQPMMPPMFNTPCAPSNGFAASSFGYPLSTPQRFGGMMPPMMPNITPGTSTAMDTSASGAGEALSQPNDLSFRPNSANFGSSFDSRQNDEDEVKNFQNDVEDDVGSSLNEGLELGRGGVSSSSMGVRPEAVILHKAVDSTASSSTVICDGAPSTTEQSATVRRTASDGALN